MSDAPHYVETTPEVHDIVTFFYPGQLPQVALLPWHIEDIMNCDMDEGHEIYKKVESYAGKTIGLMGVFVVDFCACMEVDELLVQLFLASLRDANAALKPKRPGMPAINGMDPLNRPMRVAEIIEHSEDEAPYDFEQVKIRALEWKEMYPFGEPSFKRDDKFRTFIYTDEVAQIFRKHLRTAQQMFQTIRDAEELPRNTQITVKKFCHFFHYDEADVRKALAVLYGEDEPNG